MDLNIADLKLFFRRFQLFQKCWKDRGFTVWNDLDCVIHPLQTSQLLSYMSGKSVYCCRHNTLQVSNDSVHGSAVNGVDPHKALIADIRRSKTCSFRNNEDDRFLA